MKVQKEILATEANFIKDDDTGQKKSLGPFLRISQLQHRNLIYILTYFDISVKEEDIVVENTKNTQYDYYVQVRVDENINIPSSNSQNLWSIVVDTQEVSLENKKVFCEVDFSHGVSEIVLEKILDHEPKRGTKVIIVK
ncbi:hypothetical protein KORDIASMS9_03757 [Kordia sp. SMS9]|uniref:hypothetical protein n=1 Tax=Kordia sp. SMS9 TaxID=2282170 RepID=UPI000E0D26F7|nr:hypothetical protein [Kordia sp. SMS9]AXG71500.1 hypothetical protein KORDIASMS9_03757 [Kordia sp. SMS9]